MFVKRNIMSSARFTDADQIMPVQFHDTRNTQRTVDELRLLRAMVVCALEDLNRPTVTKHGERIRNDALEWFASDETDWPFSFLRICQYLTLDPDAVRERIAKHRAHDLRECRHVVRPFSPTGKRTSRVRP